MFALKDNSSNCDENNEPENTDIACISQKVMNINLKICSAPEIPTPEVGSMPSGYIKQAHTNESQLANQVRRTMIMQKMAHDEYCRKIEREINGRFIVYRSTHPHLSGKYRQKMRINEEIKEIKKIKDLVNKIYKM